jgi:hypothetical protein
MLTQASEQRLRKEKPARQMSSSRQVTPAERWLKTYHDNSTQSPPLHKRIRQPNWEHGLSCQQLSEEQNKEENAEQDH